MSILNDGTLPAKILKIDGAHYIDFEENPAVFNQSVNNIQDEKLAFYEPALFIFMGHKMPCELPIDNLL